MYVDNYFQTILINHLHISKLFSTFVGSNLFTISPSQMFACVSVFGMVLSISIFIDSVVSVKKIKKHY